jgi:hypothetical protein
MQVVLIFINLQVERKMLATNPWSQFTQWYGNGLTYTHADQHNMAFGNYDSSKKVFGNDGGVYYSKSAGASEEISLEILIL